MAISTSPLFPATRSPPKAEPTGQSKCPIAPHHSLSPCLRWFTIETSLLQTPKNSRKWEFLVGTIIDCVLSNPHRLERTRDWKSRTNPLSAPWKVIVTKPQRARRYFNTCKIWLVSPKCQSDPEPKKRPGFLTRNCSNFNFRKVQGSSWPLLSIELLYDRQEERKATAFVQKNKKKSVWIDRDLVLMTDSESSIVRAPEEWRTTTRKQESLEKTTA